VVREKGIVSICDVARRQPHQLCTRTLRRSCFPMSATSLGRNSINLLIFGENKGIEYIDLYGATIRFSGAVKLFGKEWKVRGWTTDSDVANHLRSLRKLADETKNHDLERDLYIEERKAERGIRLAQLWPKGSNEDREDHEPTDWLKVPTVVVKIFGHCLWIVVMAIYWLLSNFGRSFALPIGALLVSVVAFHWAYLAVLKAPSAAAANTFKDAAWAYAIPNAVPFVGALTLDKDVKTTQAVT
jgi:hypothetical protein